MANLDTTGMPILPPPANPHDLGRGPMIMCISWSLSICCIIIVVLRLHVRLRAPKLAGWDDWFMLGALVLQVFHQACISIAYSFGLGKHDINLTLVQLISIAKWNWIGVIPALLVSVLARISAAILLIRIFRGKAWFKWYLIIFTGIQCLWACILIVLHYVQADPIEGLWNPFIPARRWPSYVVNYGVYLLGAMFTFSDLTYVIMPVAMIWTLKMPQRQKVGLAALLATSLITAAACILKTITTQSDKTELTPDIQYNLSMTVLWSSLEQCLVIFMSCVPPLRTAITRNSWFARTMNHFGSWNRRSGSNHLCASGTSESHATASKTNERSGSRNDQMPPVDSQGNSIRRTDTWAVSYGMANQPREYV